MMRSVRVCTYAGHADDGAARIYTVHRGNAKLSPFLRGGFDFGEIAGTLEWYFPEGAMLEYGGGTLGIPEGGGAFFSREFD